MATQRRRPPPGVGSATADAIQNLARSDPPSTLRQEAQRFRTATAIASVSVGILVILLIRWNLELSGDSTFTQTKEFGLWSLMVGIEAAVWLLVGSALLSQYSLARASTAALVRDQAVVKRMRNRSVLFAAFIVMALALPSTAGLMLGLQSQSPLWGHEWKSTIVTIIGIASALPAALALSIYHDLVKNDDAWPTADHAQETSWFDFTRGRLKTLIGLVSLQIALLVFVNSLLRRALDATQSTEGFLPSQLVLAYAGLFSAVLVGAFMYVRSPLRARAERLVNRRKCSAPIAG